DDHTVGNRPLPVHVNGGVAASEFRRVLEGTRGSRGQRQQLLEVAGRQWQSVHFISSMTVPRVEFSVCTSGDCAVTEIVACVVATLRPTSTTVLSVILTTMPSSFTGAKPLELTSSR